MKKLTVALTAILLFAACQHQNSKAPDEVASLKRELDDQTVTTKQEEEKKPTSGDINNDVDKQQRDDKSKQTRQQIPVPKEDWDKKIIKTASLNLEIKDFKVYNSTLRDKVKHVGGYIAQEQQTETEYKIENTLSIKVPVDQFDEAVQLLTKDVQKLNEKRITSDDVTTEFVDTRSRLEAKKQVRLRYLDLLKQAKNMEEILNVQSEINGIQEEIESASGRVEYLSHSSSFSTINLNFYQVLNAAASDNDKPPTFATRIANGFRFGWSWIVELFIGLVSIWPLLLVVFALVVMYKRAQKPKIKQA